MSDTALSAQVQAKTLVHILQDAAAEHPLSQGVLYINDRGEEEWISYLDVWHMARNYGRRLYEEGVRPGDRVGIILPTCKAFLGAFWGALYIGAIPFALYPPSLMVDIHEYQQKNARVFQRAKPKALVTVTVIRPVLENLSELRNTAILVPKDFEGLSEEGFSPIFRKPTDIAFLQFTSGSTTTPRGVALSHGNVIANIDAIAKGSDMTSEDVGVSWLPPYHDMGLIGKLIICVRMGVKLVWMSPQYFLRKPVRWLEAITKHKGTMSAAPNFAYSLCVKKVKEEDLERLDLSSWRLAFNGAEPVDAEVIEKFTAKFSKCGFRPETMYPVYGLAESSLAVTFPKPGSPVVYDTVDREELAEHRRAVPVEKDHPRALTLVGCGKAVPTTEIRIVNEEGEDVPEREVGEILVKGPSVCLGYFEQPEETERILKDGWLHTGDLGYLVEGTLFVTGRVKDMIIIRGKNYLPQDLEVAAQKVPGVRQGRVVAFGIPDEKQATEQCIMAVEVDEKLSEEERRRVAEEVQKAVVQATGVRPKKVCLLRPGAIPKTSSGKLQRSLTKKLYLEGKLQSRKRQKKLPWLWKLALQWLRSFFRRR